MAEEPMDRMGAFDAVMWGVESDPLLRSVIVTLVVLDGEPDIEVFLERVTRMSLVVPRLRQRVVGNPVSLIPPRWESDPNFDLDFHLRRYHVAADGTLQPVLRIAEQMAEQDFDRDRPLWEISVVSGFDDQRCAVIVKMHHAITDGVGGMAMSAALFDLTREPSRNLGPTPPAPRSNVLRGLGRLSNGVAFAARSVVEGSHAVVVTGTEIAVRSITHPRQSAAAGSEFAASAARLLAPASEPMSQLMLGRSLSVDFAVITMPMKALKLAGKSANSSINDAYMAAVAGGIATYHAAHLTSCPQIRVNMPVNMRAGGDVAAGNKWVPARFPMPIGEPDPRKRIKSLAGILKQARLEPALAISDSIYRLLSTLPQSVTTSISAGMMKGCDLAVTNLPGPPIALYAAGAEVLMIVPFAPKAGAAANVALLTYHGTAYVGVNIDSRAIADPVVFVDHLRRGFEEILALADPQARAEVGFHSGEKPQSH